MNQNTYIKQARIIIIMNEWMLNKDIFFSWLDSPSGPSPPLWDSSVTLRHVTLGGTSLDEWSALRRDLYLTTKNSRKRQTSTPHTVPASERQQTHALNRAATGVGEQGGIKILLNINKNHILYIRKMNLKTNTRFYRKKKYPFSECYFKILINHIVTC